MGYMHYFVLLFTKSQCFAGVRLWLRNPITLFTSCLEEVFSETQRGVDIREAEILHPGFSVYRSGFSTLGFGGRRDETPAP